MTANHPTHREFRTGVLILTLVCALLGPARGADDERLASDPNLSTILAYGAWVQAVTAVCRDDAPEMSGHLIQAYDDWWARNTIIRQTLRALGSGSDVDMTSESRDLFERLQSRARAIYVEKRETDPEDFTRECDAFTKDLAAGEWDYPKAKRLSR